MEIFNYPIATPNIEDIPVMPIDEIVLQYDTELNMYKIVPSNAETIKWEYEEKLTCQRKDFDDLLASYDWMIAALESQIESKNKLLAKYETSVLVQKKTSIKKPTSKRK